ncbi:MAG: rhomboid family intramembrane serine protease [Paludibacteraceae bacterium]
MNRNLPPIVKNLLVINFILFLAAWLLPNILRRWGFNIQLEDLLGMHYFGSEKFNIIQVVTYMFMHAPFPNISHIFFNMFALFMFGPILEQVWGGRKFLIYYLVSGIGAGLVQQLFWYIDMGSIFSAMDTAISSGNSEALIPYMDKISRYFRISGDISQVQSADILMMKNQLQNSLLTVGASGAIFGILLAFGWLFPEQKLFLLFIPIPIKARYFIAGYAVVELFLGVSSFQGDSVAHFAHLGGMLFGLLLILFWKKKGKLYSQN